MEEAEGKWTSGKYAISNNNVQSEVELYEGKINPCIFNYFLICLFTFFTVFIYSRVQKLRRLS